MGNNREKKYLDLDPAVEKAIFEDLKKKQDEMQKYATRDRSSVRREPEKFRIQRPNFAKDCELCG